MNRITGPIDYSRPVTKPEAPVKAATDDPMDVVLGMLRFAAERGMRCPSNAVIAERIGKGISAAAGVLRRLEDAGLITVRRFAISRVVTILDTGASTAGTASGKPHWSTRTAKPAGGGQ